MDIVLVEVSLDGIEFRALAHDNIAPNPAVYVVYVANPALWPGFAGRIPVLLNIDTQPVCPVRAALLPISTRNIFLIYSPFVMATQPGSSSDGLGVNRLALLPSRE